MPQSAHSSLGWPVTITLLRNINRSSSCHGYRRAHLAELQEGRDFMKFWCCVVLDDTIVARNNMSQIDVVRGVCQPWSYLLWFLAEKLTVDWQAMLTKIDVG